MRASPYGFNISEECVTCVWRKTQFFCSLDPKTLGSFDRIAFTSVYPAGSILFSEGEDPRGVFMLCKGQAKLSMTSTDGKTLITRVAAEGELLGLSSAISGHPYKLTVETTEPSQVKFVKRDDFVRFVKEHGDACFSASEQLSNECHAASEHVRSLGLSHSAAEKLANLILGWCETSGRQTDDGIRVKLLMTHQEIAQLIGTSRETVTRLLAEFRTKKILTLNRSTLMVRDKSALEALVFL